MLLKLHIILQHIDFGSEIRGLCLQVADFFYGKVVMAVMDNRFYDMEIFFDG